MLLVCVPVTSRQVLIDQAEQGVDYFTIHAATLLRCAYRGRPTCLCGAAHRDLRGLM